MFSMLKVPLRNEMSVVYQVPVVFIDSVIEDGHAEEIEKKRFQEETNIVKKFLESDDPYICSGGSCRNSDFSSGIPISLDTDLGTTKFG